MHRHIPPAVLEAIALDRTIADFDALQARQRGEPEPHAPRSENRRERRARESLERRAAKGRRR